MHYCAVIVHHKDLSVKDARQKVGDALVEKGEADWFSVDKYRERTFSGRVSIPFQEFVEKEDFFTVDNPLVFAFIDDGYIEYLQIPTGLYEIYGHRDRDYILSLYQQAFYDEQIRILNRIADVFETEDLIVTLLDYHD